MSCNTMLSSDEIISALKLTSKLMELHNDNPFKIKSIANATFKLDKLNIDLNNISLQELEKVEGIGKGIALKIQELKTTGSLKELNELLAKTPEGVLELMNIKGLGPKKVERLWHELNIESVGELHYACIENRLITLKGFGNKTQTEIQKQIEFLIGNKGKYHYAAVEAYALTLVEELKKIYNTSFVALTGEIRRKCEIIEKIELLIATEQNIKIPPTPTGLNIKIEIITCAANDFYYRLLETTGNATHIKIFREAVPDINIHINYQSEKEIYDTLNLQYIEPELREGFNEVALSKEKKIPKLIELTDLKGSLHNHTNYSDGANSVKEMADYCKALGYEYLGICDHSKSAIYANGLDEKRILEQHTEIDTLNKNYSNFKIFKGIESDILSNGQLDYSNDILKTFDLVVASIHSGLKMDAHKATERLIKAIENPYTTILGHPSGRLLLSRQAYPLNYKKIIDACSANNVIIELNANPYRLDIDWRHITYCIEKNVMVSINPDAHIKEGFHDMYFGICVARKGMLTEDMCFNALSLPAMVERLKK